MRRFKRQWERHEFKGEVNSLPSMTEPNMALTPREVLDRFASGRSVDISSNLAYTGDDLLPDINTLDLAEVQELMERNNEHIAELKAEIQQAKARKKALEKERKSNESTANESSTDKGAN